MPLLLELPAAVEMSPDAAYEARHMLADKGHSVSPAMNQAWSTRLTQLQRQLAGMHITAANKVTE
jgi:hypothetical protein